MNELEFETGWNLKILVTNERIHNTVQSKLVKPCVYKNVRTRQTEAGIAGFEKYISLK
jgi:hypothetical protein